MVLPGISPWSVAGEDAVVDMAPVVARSRRRIDANPFDGVDRVEHLLDFRPTADMQQPLAAGGDIRDRGERLPRSDGAQDVDARLHGAEVVGTPANQGEDRARGEGQHPAAAIDDPFSDRSAEADPAFDAPLEPQKVDLCLHDHGPFSDQREAAR